MTDPTVDDGYHEDDADVWDDGYTTVTVPRAATGVGRPRRDRRYRQRRALIILLAIVVVFLAVVGLLRSWYTSQVHPGGKRGALVAVTIPPASSTAQIGSLLAKDGVIHDGSLFRYYVKLHGDGPLLPGAYQLAKNSSYDSVISTLVAGPKIVVQKLTIPEGYTLRQIATKVAALSKLHLSADKFLAAASTGAVRSPYEPTGLNNLEGLVFPATYEVKQGDSEAQVLQQMVSQFTSEASHLGLDQAAATLHLTPYQVIITASIVEREAKLDADRGPVASTLYNRIKAAKPLGADSTLVYALRQANPDLDLSKVDYNQPNPYNTRLIKGLPPTPISNPGIPSLEAAATPPATTYLFFVEVNPDGQLGFASTDAGFRQLENSCRAAKLC
ncbi:MAG: endolytic transglycosylase MltG [Actinomycetota bacterium]|nr:endolytic transglycosylase MltG [Actinomycetota bacterium]